MQYLLSQLLTMKKGVKTFGTIKTSHVKEQRFSSQTSRWENRISVCRRPGQDLKDSAKQLWGSDM